jgi:hypothetical protein
LSVVREIEPWDQILAAGREDERLVTTSAVHARPPRAAPFPEDLHPDVVTALEGTKVNPLFYDGRLTAPRYVAWLRDEGVRWVALADEPLDFSARAEATLLRRGVPELRPAARLDGWRVWELRDAPRDPIAAAGPQSLTLDLPAGRTVLHRRFTPYWSVEAGRACVARASGDRVALTAPRAGRVVLRARLGGARCRG